MITTETLLEVLGKIEAEEKPVGRVSLIKSLFIPGFSNSDQYKIQFDEYAALVAQLSSAPAISVENFFAGRYWEQNSELGDEASMHRGRWKRSSIAIPGFSLPFIEDANIFCLNADIYMFPTALGYIGDKGIAIEYRGFGVIQKETHPARMRTSRFIAVDKKGKPVDTPLKGIYNFLVFYPGDVGQSVSLNYLKEDAARTKEPAVSGSMGRIPAANVAAYDSTNLHLALPSVESADSQIVDGPMVAASTGGEDPALLVQVPDLKSLRTSAILYRMNSD